MRPIALMLLIAGGLSCQTKQATPCDLAEPKRFEGTMISLRGRLSFSMHGAYFLTDTCDQNISAPIILFPNTKFAPAVEFDADTNSAERLGPFLRVSGGSSVACGTLTGKLFYKRTFRLKKHGGTLSGNGFGPNGRSRMAFVIKSVNEIGACP